MPPLIELGAYFDRIGYVPGAAHPPPVLETIRAIQLCHAQAIPFENLNPFLGWPVRLDADSLQRKIVRDGRGGYCYEHNLLFSSALRELGFDVSWLAGRVVLDAEQNTLGPRTHMLLLVTIAGGRYVVDVGFGGLTLTAPLRLAVDVEQTTPHEPCRVVKTGDQYMVQAKAGGTWRSLYRFGMEEQSLQDYEISNWYLSSHPKSKFVTALIAARPDADRRHALRNNQLTVHHLDGRTERRVLHSAAELAGVLRTVFRITLADTAEVHQALARVAATA
jgi:N-hydroxyarylamine O-acetyltransferase